MATHSKYVIGVIYRHPNSNTQNFSESLNDRLFQLKSKSKQFFILGDLNIDTSADKLNIASIQYLNILASHGTKFLIDKPTRVTPTSATILHYALTNVSISSVLPAIIHYDITDHYPIFLKLLCFKKTKRIKNNNKFYRTLRSFNPELFCDDLHSKLQTFLSNQARITSDTCENAFDTFYSLILQTVNQHAPFKKLTRKQKRLNSKPWITKGLLNSIKN